MGRETISRVLSPPVPILACVFAYAPCALSHDALTGVFAGPLPLASDLFIPSVLLQREMLSDYLCSSHSGIVLSPMTMEWVLGSSTFARNNRVSITTPTTTTLHASPLLHAALRPHFTIFTICLSMHAMQCNAMRKRSSFASSRKTGPLTP